MSLTPDWFASNAIKIEVVNIFKQPVCNNPKAECLCQIFGQFLLNSGTRFYEFVTRMASEKHSPKNVHFI